MLVSLPALPNSLQYLGCENNFLTTLPALPDSLKTLYCSNNNILCFPNFPPSILAPDYNYSPWLFYIELNNNPFTCLPNYLPGKMRPSILAYPLCTLGNTNGCPVSSVGLNENKKGINSMSIYPNPANSELNIEFLDLNNPNYNLLITNTLRQTVHNTAINNQRSILNIIDFPPGIYFVTIKTGNETVTKKVVIEH
jgi:hypothetical protein